MSDYPTFYDWYIISKLSRYWKIINPFSRENFFLEKNKLIRGKDVKIYVLFEKCLQNLPIPNISININISEN